MNKRGVVSQAELDWSSLAAETKQRWLVNALKRKSVKVAFVFGHLLGSKRKSLKDFSPSIEVGDERE